MKTTIMVNDQPTDIDPGLQIYQLLVKMSIPTNGIAIAINDEIQPQENWKTTSLKDQDKVLIIQATQGG